MRAILHADIVALGRVLLCVEADERKWLCARVFEQAHAADKYRKKLGKAHVQWGTGSLASACAGLDRMAEPFLSDPDYASCIRIIFDRILLGKSYVSRVRK
jgi:hypothetical protein